MCGFRFAMQLDDYHHPWVLSHSGQLMSTVSLGFVPVTLGDSLIKVDQSSIIINETWLTSCRNCVFMGSASLDSFCITLNAE